MKVCYFADGPWAHKALNKIIASGQFVIQVIIARYENPDCQLKQLAINNNIPFITAKNVNSVEFLEIIRKFDPDINVSMSFNQIFKKEILNIAPKGFINCHAGNLPFYRGRNVLNWALINGEKEFGVTVHYIDQNIDTGNIILQKVLPIDKTDDYNTLLNKAYELCAQTLYEALILIKKNQVQPIRQHKIHPLGFYCGMRRNGDEFIDWNWSSWRIYNFIRAITKPAPGARTFIEDNEVIILKSEYLNDAPDYIGTPGEIIGRDINGNYVKTGDSFIKIIEIADLSSSGEIINERIPNLPIGLRLGIGNPMLEIKKLNKKIKEIQKEIKLLKNNRD